MSSITDDSSNTLLSITRITSDGTGNITAVSDAYGRSVYYHCGTYATANVPVPYSQSYQELDQASQIVVTGTANPPIRSQYGYQNVTNGDGTETVPYLHTIGVPSPTGTGTSTATINYQPSTCVVSSIVDANGNTRSYTAVDQNHTKITVKNPQNVVVYIYTVGFDNNMSGTTITNGAVDANGNNNTLVYSASYSDPNDPYRPSTSMDGNGYASGGAKGTKTATWDQYGNILTLTNARGTTTTLTWDYTSFALGDLVQVQEAGKAPSSCTYYQPNGLNHTVTTPLPGTSNGNTFVTRTYTFDSLGNVLTETAPGNGTVTSITTTYNYTQDGAYSLPVAVSEPLTITDNAGHVTHLRYDARGNVTSILSPVGNETDRAYNIADQRTQVVLPATGQTGAGHTTEAETYLYAAGPAIANSGYNESATLIRQVSHAYGLEGESLSVTGSTEPVAYTYDAAYRRKTLTDGNNHVTAWTYNLDGYLASVSFPNASGNYDTVQYTARDASGNVLTRVDGRGITTNFVYSDSESRITDVQYPATPALNAHNTYDVYGRLATHSDGTGAVAYSYDDFNKPTAVQTTYTGLPAQTISYTFYPNGSRQLMTTPAGQFSYSYDSIGRLSGEINPFAESFSWTYLDNNWLWTQQTPGVTTTFTYNARGLLTDMANRVPSTNALLSEFGGAIGSGSEMFYDGVGNRTSMAANLPGVSGYSGLTSYSFDAKNQLTQEQSACLGGYTNSSGYDSAGNATTFRGSGRTYNPDNQQTGNTYDGDGNPTAYGGVSCTFDPEDRLTAYGAVITAGYMTNGLRAWKQSSAGRTYFLYDGSVLVCELNSSGAITATNTFGVSGLAARRAGGSSVFYAFDPRGNTVERVNSSGTVLDSSTFDAFGARSTTGAGTDPYGGFGSQFGSYVDIESGLSWMGTRYFDPSRGRFVTRDAMGYDGGINLYNYAGNSPIAFAEFGGGSTTVVPPQPPSAYPNPPECFPDPWPAPEPEPPVVMPEPTPAPVTGPGTRIPGPVAGVVIVCGIEAGYDLCRWRPGGPCTGPFTCIGTGIGNKLFPDPGELPADPLPPCTVSQEDPDDGTETCYLSVPPMVTPEGKICHYWCDKAGVTIEKVVAPWEPCDPFIQYSP